MPLWLLHEKQRESCAVRYQRCKASYGDAGDGKYTLAGLWRKGSKTVIGEGLVKLGQNVCGG